MVWVATVGRISAEAQLHLQGAVVPVAVMPKGPAAVARVVPQMVLTVSALPQAMLLAVAAAMEQRSQPGSLAFPLTWDRIPSAGAEEEAEILVLVPAALAAAVAAAVHP